MAKDDDPAHTQVRDRKASQPSRRSRSIDAPATRTGPGSRSRLRQNAARR